MRVYRWAWWTSWSLVALLVVGFAAIEASPMGVLVAFVLLLGASWVVRRLLPPGWRPPGSLGMAVGAMTVWACSWITPSLGLLVVLLATASYPPVVGRVLRSARRTAGRAADRHRDPPLPPPRAEGDDPLSDAAGTAPHCQLTDLDDRQLCRLWRESFWRLHEPASPETLLRLVAVREACLDELERRDSSALHAWLDHGARASGGPEKYLTHPPPRDPEA